jgi:hypothetical protein
MQTQSLNCDGTYVYLDSVETLPNLGQFQVMQFQTYAIKIKKGGGGGGEKLKIKFFKKKGNFLGPKFKTK